MGQSIVQYAVSRVNEGKVGLSVRGVSAGKEGNVPDGPARVFKIKCLVDTICQLGNSLGSSVPVISISWKSFD